jgi:hypothetical protein
LLPKPEVTNGSVIVGELLRRKKRMQMNAAEFNEYVFNNSVEPI